MGMSPVAMGILMGILALVIIAVFAYAFLRDRNRSDKVSDDEERIGTEQPRHDPSTGH